VGGNRREGGITYITSVNCRDFLPDFSSRCTYRRHKSTNY
jgi:hypothetical protein